MKKLIAITSVILITVMFLTAFVACDEKDDEQVITADTKFEDIVSDKITEEELISLIKEAYKGNGNYRAKMILSEKYDGHGIESTRLYEVNNTTIKMESTNTYTYYDSDETYTSTHYSYTYKEGDNYYELTSRDNENWEKEKSYSGIHPGVYEMYLLSLIEAEVAYEDIVWELDVDLFEWDEQDKGYYVIGSDYEGLLKFKNGRLCAISSTEAGFNYNVVFYDFGKVPEITLPEIAE